jgi:hypothetical protein
MGAVTEPTAAGLLTAAQAAQLAGVQPRTIATWRRRGHLAEAAPGQYDPADVWRCARDRRPPAETSRLKLAAQRWREVCGLDDEPAVQVGR